MGSKEYWAERERAKQLKVDEVTDVEVEKVRDAIDKAINSLDDEIHRIYMKYAVDNEMSYADTLKYLTNDERKEFQKDLQYYIEKNRDTEYVKKHAKELHSLSVRARVKRIEAFIAKIKQHSADLEELLNNGTREQISSLYTEGYLRQIYELSGGLTPEKGKIASAFNTRAVRQILDTPWSGSNYSDKVWNITDSFTDKLQQTLTQGLIQGQHPDVIARNFRQYGFGKSGAGGLAYRAETLIRTEAANIIEQAQKEAYKDHKIKEYYFMTAKDQRVCDKCAPLNGKLFSVDEAAQGKNYPPMHPCCRCTTKAKTRFDDNDDEYYKLYEDDYDAWYKKYVEPELDKVDAEPIYTDLGNLKNGKAQIEKHFGKLNTDSVILMKERLEHIKDHHPMDGEALEKYAKDIATDPDEIFIDHKNPKSIIMVKKCGDESKYNAFVRLTLAGDNPNYKNSIISGHRLNDKTYKRLVNKNKKIYTKGKR